MSVTLEEDGLGKFEPCFIYNAELDLLTWLNEDCGYYSNPVSAAHAADALYAMDDQRIVGVQLWGAHAAIKRDLAERSLTGSGELAQQLHTRATEIEFRCIVTDEPATIPADNDGEGLARKWIALDRDAANYIGKLERTRADQATSLVELRRRVSVEGIAAKDARISLLEEALRPFAVSIDKTLGGVAALMPRYREERGELAVLPIEAFRRAASILDETDTP